MTEKSSPLTQFIFVDPHQDRLTLIHDAASASALSLAHDSDLWDEWVSTDYRKSVRALKRARDVEADCIVETVKRDTMVSAAATVPMTKELLPSPLRRTQVSGWDSKVIVQDSAEPSNEENVLLINDSLGMSVGKMAAQAAHALMMVTLDRGVVPSFSVALADEEMLRDVKGYLMKDNGLTEIPAGSLTAAFHSRE